MRRILFCLGLLLFFSLNAVAEGPESSLSTPKRIHVAILIDKLDEFRTHFVRITQAAADQLDMRISVFHGHEFALCVAEQAKASGYRLGQATI